MFTNSRIVTPLQILADEGIFSFMPGRAGAAKA
jgi:hypothetical protein